MLRYVLFLLDGQKIATKLSRRISVVGKMLKKSLSQYNSGIPEQCHISWAEAIDFSSSLYSDGLYCDDATIPAIVKSQAVQLHHRICRCEEEVTRLKSEMTNCVEHYLNVYKCLLKCAGNFQDSEDRFSLGRMCLLRKAKAKCVRQLKSFECFLKYTELPGLENMPALHVDDEEFYAPEQGNHTIRHF